MSNDTQKNSGKRTISQELVHSFHKLQIWITLAVMLVLAVAFGFYINRQMMRSNEEGVRQVRQQTEQLYDHMISGMKLAVSGINQVEHGGDVTGNADTAQFSDSSRLFTTFEYYLVSFPELAGILYVDPRGEATVAGNIGRPEEAMLRVLTDQIPDSGVISAALMDCWDLELYQIMGSPAWIIGQRVINMDTGENLGYLFFTVSKETLSACLPLPEQGRLAGIYQLVRPDGDVIADRDASRWDQRTWEMETFLRRTERQAEEEDAEGLLTWMGGGALYLCQPVRGGNWYLLVRQPLINMLRDILLLLALLAVTMMICTWVSKFLVQKAARQISGPVEALTDVALRIGEGETALRYHGVSQDEVGTLGRVFNEMLDKTEQMNRTLGEIQEQKRVYELELLQQQIKPHFLYNTLNLIYVSCQNGDTQTGADIVMNLADFYRTSLSSGEQIILVREELKNAVSYLEIQKARFPRLFTYDIQVPEEMMDCPIPKLTLQPIIENAINHGLRPDGIPGEVRVEGFVKEGRSAILRVTDTGRGMDEETRLRLLDPSREESKGHFGLSSTNKRLKLYFGESYGLEILSAPGKGTTVEIHMSLRGAALTKT